MKSIIMRKYKILWKHTHYSMWTKITAYLIFMQLCIYYLSTHLKYYIENLKNKKSTLN